MCVLCVDTCVWMCMCMLSCKLQLVLTYVEVIVHQFSVHPFPQMPFLFRFPLFLFLFVSFPLFFVYVSCVDDQLPWS